MNHPPYRHTGYPQPSPCFNTYPQQYHQAANMAPVATGYPSQPLGMLPTYTAYNMPPSPAHQQPMMPESPSSISAEQEENNIRENTPGPPAACHTWEGKTWGLRVVQEPLRARMCGFGDKDRRPISAPPILKLVVLDEKGIDIDYQDPSLELSHFVCMVDIYDKTGIEEKNMLRATQSQQSISTAQCGTYPTTRVDQTMTGNLPTSVNGDHPNYLRIHGEAGPLPAPYQSNGPQTALPGYPPSPYVNGAYSNAPHSAFPPASGPPQYLGSGHRNMPAPNPYAQPQLPGINSLAGPPVGTYGSTTPLTPPAEISSSSSSPGYNRTLIGQLCSSAQRLKDSDDRAGIWFIFPDLSVRTEDWFRLKFSFFNVGKTLSGLSFNKVWEDAASNNCVPTSGTPDTVNPKRIEGLRAGLVAERAPCLAYVFSKPFKVYSAKKFPGVAESTSLSKVFANQGIKISIRKDPDAKKRKRRPGDSTDEEDGDEDDDAGKP